MAINRRKMILSAGVGVAGYALYRQAPIFFDQFGSELFMTSAEPIFRPDPKVWKPEGLHTAWLGHATTLIQIDGFTILTDPSFSIRIGVDMKLATLGPKRLVAPALRIDQLPKIDLVLLSHAHFDHWDLPSLRAIAKTDIPVICARATSDLLTPSSWKSVRELGWGESTQVGPVNLKAIEVRHWGARVRSDTYRGYNGYVIEAGKYRVLFAGDTSYTQLFKNVRSSRPFDLAIMPIGAYNPWITSHCTPEQAIEMAGWAGVERIMPVHHQTFVLSREPVMEPIERFMSAIGSDTSRAVAHEIGSEWSVIT